MKKTTLQHNKELAFIFRKMADCYRYLGPDQRFRALAYETASKTLSNMQEPVDIMADDIKKLDKLKGVGESIATKIIEYLHSGRIKTFEKLKKEVPYSLLELMDIEGFGPATVRLLHEKLHIKSKEELIKAIEQGKLIGTKGLASKKIENMMRVLKLESTKKRMSLSQAQITGNRILSKIEKIQGIHMATLAGSLRRKKETVGDIDIVLTAEAKQWNKIINTITKFSEVEKVISAGHTKASVLLKPDHVQLDVRIVHDDEYGATLFYFTGSKEHNIKLRTMAKQKGWKINEYGVFNARSGKKLAGKTEEDIYALFGLNYIPPEKRVGKDELEEAKRQ